MDPLNSTLNADLTYDNNPLFEPLYDSEILLNSTIRTNLSGNSLNSTRENSHESGNPSFLSNVTAGPGNAANRNASLDRILEEQRKEEKILTKKLKKLKLVREIERLERETKISDGTNAPKAAPASVAIRKSLAFDQLKNEKSKLFQNTKKEQNKVTLELCRNGHKIPKFKKNSCVLQFLTQDLHLFITDQGLTQTNQVLPFVHHAFSSLNMRYRLSSIIDEVLTEHPEVELLDFLIELGKKLNPRVQKFDPSLHKRKNNECVQDCVYRLLSHALASSYPENVLCSLIASTLVDHESQPTVRTEISREIIRLDGKFTPENLLAAAKVVDRVLKLDDLSESLDESDLLLSVATTAKNLCQKCQKTPVGVGPSGFPYRFCYDCRSHRKISFQETKVCISCKKPHSDRNKFSNEIFPKCKNCYFSTPIPSQSHFPARDHRDDKNFTGTAFKEMKSFSEVVSGPAENADVSFLVYSEAEPDLEIALKDNADLGNGRLKIQIKSSNGLITQALCDTGANSNVIEFSLLEKYGLANKMIKSSEPTFAHGFSGKSVPVLGTIILPLVTGNKNFNMKFEVVSNLARFKAILGTPYLERVGVMSNIKSKLRENEIEVSEGN